jgi:hypothetical protein
MNKNELIEFTQRLIRQPSPSCDEGAVNKSSCLTR